MKLNVALNIAEPLYWQAAPRSPARIIVMGKEGLEFLLIRASALPQALSDSVAGPKQKRDGEYCFND